MDYVYDEDYSYTTTGSDYFSNNESPEVNSTVLVTTLIISLVIFIFAIAIMWKIFTKAGQKGWKSIVPIYNMYVLFTISGLKGWLIFIPIVNGIFSLVCYFKLAKSFGKSAGFALGILFLPVIFLPMLAFGKSEYIGPNGEKQNSTNTETINNNAESNSVTSNPVNVSDLNQVGTPTEQNVNQNNNL